MNNKLAFRSPVSVDTYIVDTAAELGIGTSRFSLESVWGETVTFENGAYYIESKSVLAAAIRYLSAGGK